MSGLDNPTHYVEYMRSLIYDYLQPYCLITFPSPVDYVTSRWSGFSLSRRVEIICETATCVAFFDGYPVSPDHALIVPKRHVSSYFDLTDHEREAMNVMLQYVKRVVDKRFHPDGYNIGINVGQAAGQSVYQCHMHLIPRYAGDVENPKGGVRGVIPEKQKY